MKQDRVIALGFFDGVHLGHSALLQTARQEADRRGCIAAVLTFSNHPDKLVFGRETPLINTVDEREQLMTELYAIDQVLSIPFDRALMQMPWEVFVEDLLVATLGCVHVVCGHDFTFGHRGAGTPERLREKCAELGLGCHVIDQVVDHGTPISSTRIRLLLQQGQVEEANRLLGHPHFLTGTVEPGKQLGRQMGIPTANLRLAAGVMAPAFGVYAGQVRLADGSRHPAVLNVGICPTIGLDTGITVEPWLLDFSGDLYGQTVQVEFCKFLRPEQRFDTLEDLREAILKDAAATRTYFQI